MDKSWMNLSRVEPEYIQGVIDFIEFACKNLPVGATEIICPCRSCRNVALVKIDVVKEHLLMPGISTSYTRWIFHGEKTSSECGVESSQPSFTDGRDEMNDLLLDAFGIVPPNRFHDSGMGVGDQPCAGIEGPDEETKKFFDLLKEADRKLYPECEKFSLLSFVVRLMHIKCLSGWSNKSFTLLLKLLKDAFPEGETLPGSFRATKKLLQGLGLDYYKIHACPNDCMLYWGENANCIDCKKCQKARYKQFEQQDGPNKGNAHIPQKIVRYFPLIPRLKRLFTASKTASLMTWHAENPAPNGIMRHPVDSGAWKHFDELYPDFALDPRNVRLGLASDGFNPFRTMNISHSTWPVVLMTYNLPPWLCMKQPYMMLSLLIDGPKAPGNDIDVYLSLVVGELKELWDKGVDTYDAATNQMFKMRALLLWTINDFPAYANLSGWSTKGRFACPCCHVNTRSRYLSHGRKMCYLGHRRWLGKDHKFRTDSTSFDGTTELDMAPARLSGSELLAMFPANYENDFGKHDEDDEDMQSRKKRKAPKKDHLDGDPESLYNLKKKSIFLMELPYWKDNLIRHNLDVMHIEKNVCDNVLSTIFDSDRKGKDGKNARLDLQEMGIRKQLHPQSRVGKRPLCPSAPFPMEKKQKTMFCNFLKKVKVPDGYASNISRCVNVKKHTINGLKSHDSHILMEQLLPIAVSRTLPSKISKPIIELCNFFRLICSKVQEVSELDRLQSRIALTLCHLEQIFTPTFFDVMEHLPIHLAEEAKIGGPVRFRWMYFVERYLMTLKNYVRNRAKPEGSIAEGYLVEECMTFCSRYLNDVESKLNRPNRNYDGVGDGEVARALGKEETFIIGEMHKNQAHRYILFNNDAVAPYREKHREFLKQVNSRIKDRELDILHHQMFPLWFQKHVHNLQVSKCEQVTDEIADLALGPRDTSTRYNGYYLNGVRYHTKQREARRKTQNSGVKLEANTSSYASAKDNNPQDGKVTYYGKISDIVELYYVRNRRYVLFKCDWIDNNKGLVEEDAFGFTLVNFKHLLYRVEHASNEPFILAYQAQQVFYIQDPAQEDWNIVLHMKSRDLYEACTQLPTEAEIITDVEVEGIGQQQLDDDALNV